MGCLRNAECLDLLAELASATIVDADHHAPHSSDTSASTVRALKPRCLSGVQSAARASTTRAATRGLGCVSANAMFSSSAHHLPHEARPAARHQSSGRGTGRRACTTVHLVDARRFHARAFCQFCQSLAPCMRRSFRDWLSPRHARGPCALPRAIALSRQLLPPSLPRPMNGLRELLVTH